MQVGGGQTFLKQWWHMGLLAVLLVSPLGPLKSWGFQAHRDINGRAVDLLSGPLGDFFQAHRPWLVALSTDPDQRRNYTPDEGPRHYIDLEYYGVASFTALSFDNKVAEERFGRDKLKEWGYLPWHLLAVLNALKEAMAADEWERAIVLAADLGHYVGDAHMPLHTTSNYDGQDTGNKGVHHLFEGVMMDRYMAEYKPSGLALLEIDDPAAAIFGWLSDSYGLIDGLLAADTEARRGLSDDQIEVLKAGYSADQAAISEEYIQRLYAATGSMAWQQLALATVRLASLWQWAWEAAGQPQPPR
ncbi:MAG: hypothetical protein KAU50_10195 [Candidatus Marinimicrobia bacterium]|nr:hypothetical protein [Candidatus Neomarinimicrobiota bacterium]